MSMIVLTKKEYKDVCVCMDVIERIVKKRQQHFHVQSNIKS